MNDKDAKTIINLLRKQNAILADILKRLPNEEIEKIEERTVDTNDISVDMIPKLTSNERTLEICHVIKNGILYTFNQGVCVESRKATNFEQYVYRSADDEEKKD